MLVLSRKIGQSVIVNDNIELQIVDIRRDTVRLGIQAPKDVSVHRKEVWDIIDAREKDNESNIGRTISRNSQKN